MFKTTGLVALVAAVLTGCASSGPTYSAYTVTLANGEQAHRVDCYGIFEGGGTCHSKAQDICGNENVRVIEDVATQGGETKILTFQCGVKAPPPQPVVMVSPPPPAPPPPAPPRKITLNGDANFETAKATLTPMARDNLDRLLSDARDFSFTTVTVNGYTDSVGSVPYNVDLSDRRAHTVAQYLGDHGLRAQRFVMHGYGKADPVASNDTAGGRAQNRRVEITLEQN